MKTIQVVVLAFLLVSLVAACAPAAAPATQLPQTQAASPAKPAAPATVGAAAPAIPAWQQQWNKTLEAAKKEGTIVLLTTAGPRTRAALGAAFKSEFGIGVEWIAGSSAELSVKIMNERRAKIYSTDVTVIGYSTPVLTLKPAGAIDPLEKALFLPDLTDPQEIQKAWRFGLEWVDKDHTTLNFSTAVNYSVMVNTTLVKPGEIKSFNDLLDPKWKDKMVMLDPGLGAGPGSDLSLALGLRIMGWDYLQKLSKQVMLTRDARLQGTWVAQGKYPVGIAFRPETVTEFLSVGAPVQVLALEEGGYTTPGAAAVALVNQAPHPNAARFFINWLLSKEGQTVYCTAQGVPSNRIDVNIEGLYPLVIPDPKKKYVAAGTEEWLLERPEALKKVQAIFAPR